MEQEKNGLVSLTNKKKNNKNQQTPII